MTAKNGRVDDAGLSVGKKFVKRFEVLNCLACFQTPACDPVKFCNLCYTMCSTADFF